MIVSSSMQNGNSVYQSDGKCPYHTGGKCPYHSDGKSPCHLHRHNVYHLDGPGVARHSDAILSLPNLQAIHWVQGYGIHEPIMQWLPLIKKIQEAGKSVIVDLKIHELEEFTKNVEPTGIMLWIPADPGEQKDILGRVRHW